MTYSVKESSEVSKAGDTYGSVQYGSQQLFIDPTLCQEMKEQTLLHEILHICVFSSGFYKILDNKDHHTTEEELVCALEGPLYAILKDNKLRFDDSQEI